MDSRIKLWFLYGIYSALYIRLLCTNLYIAVFNYGIHMYILNLYLSPHEDSGGLNFDLNVVWILVRSTRLRF